MTSLINYSSKESNIDKMTSYFGRQTNYDDIREVIGLRYFSSVRKTPQNPNNPNEQQLEYYEKGLDRAAINSKKIGVISIGIGNKIAKALATLFNQSGCTFKLVTPTDKDISSIQEVLDNYRKYGGFKPTLTDVDIQACQIGSSCLLITWENGLKYNKVSPSQVKVYFQDTVIDNGIERPANKRNLEDAYCVTINLGSVSVGVNRYLGIFAKNADYTQGRYVYYVGNSDSVIFDEDYEHDRQIIDYEINGEFANPLSELGNRLPDLNLPEFPLIMIDGNICESEEIFPITESLYNDSIEADIAASHILSKSQEQINGTQAIIRTQQSASTNLPKSLDGAVALGYGQDIKAISHNHEGAESADRILSDMIINIAAAYNVPDYMVSSKDHTVEAASGEALKVKTQPLLDDRKKRIDVNQLHVLRLFEIEKAYIYIFSDLGDTEKTDLVNCSQSWLAGEIQIPENKQILVTRLATAYDKGFIDIIQAIKEYYNFATDDEAIQQWELMNERTKTYQPLKAQKQTLGLTKTTNV